MLNDFKKFSLLQKLLALIDLILNPNAYDYPFLVTLNLDMKCPVPSGYFIVKRYIKNNEQHLWAIRWIPKWK